MPKPGTIRDRQRKDIRERANDKAAFKAALSLPSSLSAGANGSDQATMAVLSFFIALFSNWRIRSAETW